MVEMLKDCFKISLFNHKVHKVFTKVAKGFVVVF